jgi:hypothetical protein
MAGEFLEPIDGDIIVTPVELNSFDRLDMHARKCMYWQTNSGTHDYSRGSTFEKEAWLSSVLLLWGVCAQVAEEFGRPVGSVTYAPPGNVARVRAFPSGPVGSDAVLIADLHAHSDFDANARTDIRSLLLAAVVSDAAKRGVRALETFARTNKGSERLEMEFHASELHASGPLTCLQEDEFFLARGFEEVGKDPEFPRLRLEIDGEHLWKADVEHALDQLIFEANMRPSAVNSQ